MPAARKTATARKLSRKTTVHSADPIIEVPPQSASQDRLIVPRETGDVAAIEQHAVPTEEIVPEGDYAGMRYEEVMMICKEQAESALGNMSIEGASAVVDMLMEDCLQVTLHYKGKVAAKEAGINYCKTALKYAMLDVSQEPDRIRSMSEAIEELRKKRG